MDALCHPRRRRRPDVDAAQRRPASHRVVARRSNRHRRATSSWRRRQKERGSRPRRRQRRDLASRQEACNPNCAIVRGTRWKLLSGPVCCFEPSLFPRRVNVGKRATVAR